MVVVPHILMYHGISGPRVVNVELDVATIGELAVHAENRRVGVLAAKPVLNRIEVGQPSAPTEQKQHPKGAARFHSTNAKRQWSAARDH